MNWTKNHTYIALGVLAVAGIVLWMRNDKKEKSAKKEDKKNTAPKDETLVQSEMGRQASTFSTFINADAQPAKPKAGAPKPSTTPFAVGGAEAMLIRK